MIPEDSVAEFLDGLAATLSNNELTVPSQSQNPSDLLPAKETATIFNLTHSILDVNMIRLLKRGSKFVPTPTYLDREKTETLADLDHLASKVRGRCNLLTFNRQTNSVQNEQNMVKASAVKPSKATSQPSVATACQQIVNTKPEKKNRSATNMDKELYQALASLKSSPEWIIKEADKGSGIVIMEKGFYVNAINEMLEDTSTYEIVHNMTCTKLIDRVKKFNKKWESILNQEEMKAIIEHDSSLATFYGLPKIHKSALIREATRNNQNSVVVNCSEPVDLKFRPIISCRQCPTTKLCEVLNNILQPFMEKVKYRLRDTYDFLKKCPENAEDDTYFITADITALYTNITTEKGLEAISYYIDTYGNGIIPSRFTKEFILDLFTFCQSNLYFTLGDTIYRQVSGTGMGRIYAPAAADLKVGYQEIQVDMIIGQRYGVDVARYFMSNYFRYLDDVFMVWHASLPNHEAIIVIFNSIDPNIQFTVESSHEINRISGGIPFLDVEVYLKDGRILFDLYSKDTDTYNYLPFSSSHPRHCSRNIPYCLARRIIAFVSEDQNVSKRLHELKMRLTNKGYPSNLISEGIRRAKLLSRHDILHGREDPSKENGDGRASDNPVYFVTTHNPRAKNLTHQINGIVDNLNRDMPNGKSVQVKASFRKSPSLKDQLMYQRMLKPQVRKCGKNCIFCAYITTGSTIVLKNGMKVHTNGDFECSSRNVVYIATCDGCKESYIGETGDQLLSRWTVHRQQSKLAPLQAPVQADVHLRLCGNNKYSVFPFFRPRRNNIFLRRRYEESFIEKFKPKLNGKLYH